MLGIYYIYISSRFSSYSIKLVTLRLHNYNFLEKIIRRVEKYFIKRLNAAVLDTMSTYYRRFRYNVTTTRRGVESS